MSRRIYLASSWRNPEQPRYVQLLRDAGHEVYDFRNPPSGSEGFSWRKVTDSPPPWSAEQTRDVIESPPAQAGLRDDFDGMKWSDTIVMLQPCGVSAALELGWGIGSGRVCAVVLADYREPELMLRLAAALVVDERELLAWLLDLDIMASRRLPEVAP